MLLSEDIFNQETSTKHIFLIMNICLNLICHEEYGEIIIKSLNKNQQKELIFLKSDDENSEQFESKGSGITVSDFIKGVKSTMPHDHIIPTISTNLKTNPIICLQYLISHLNFSSNYSTEIIPEVFNIIIDNFFS